MAQHFDEGDHHVLSVDIQHGEGISGIAAEADLDTVPDSENSADVPKRFHRGLAPSMFPGGNALGAHFHPQILQLFRKRNLRQACFFAVVRDDLSNALPRYPSLPSCLLRLPESWKNLRKNMDCISIASTNNTVP